MSETCDLCGGGSLGEVYRPETGRRGLAVHVCADCGLVQSLPRIDRVDDRTVRVSSGADWGNVRYGKGFRAGAALAAIERRIEPPRLRAVLDVGAGRGSFLSQLPRVDVVAVEPDDALAAAWEGRPSVTRLAARIEDVELPASKFDLVHVSHTLEHLRSPRATLAALRRALAPDGLLFVEVPSLDFVGRQDVVEEWFVDKHLFHFSRATLPRLLAVAGFEPLDVAEDAENVTIVARPGEPVAAAPDPDEAERARELVRRYADRRARNLASLRGGAAAIASFAPRRVAVWGAGRILDALVEHGGLDPRSLVALVDGHLREIVAEVHGVRVRRPDELPALAPDVVVVASREYEAEIRREAADLVPAARIVTFSELVLAEVARSTRRYALTAIHAAGSGHPGGSLSAADLLAYLYARELRGLDALDEDRDRFVLSKGHCAPALYGVWAAVGLLDPELVPTLRKLGSPLQGHADVLFTPLAETSTGSLGQGFSAAIGMALGLRHRGSPARVYVMLGDGELEEGQVWEGAMCAAHHRLGNLCAIVDYNKLQSDDTTETIAGLEPLAAKWDAFGWRVVEIDGHDFAEIEAAFAGARDGHARPTLVLAHTVKGKGVSFMEGDPPWHGSVKLRDEELEAALRDLGGA